jgi:hemolysin activation/secretion protein
VRPQLLAYAVLGIVALGATSARSQTELLPTLPETGPTPERAVERPREPEAPVVTPPGGGPSFVLTGIVLEGARALSEAELAPAWQPYIGENVTVATLESIAARIGAAYRDRGYFISQAILPAQTVAGGVVRIQVVEGFVNRLSVGGGAANQQKIAQRYFAPVPADRPLRLTTLERSVLLSRDTFGSVYGDSVETVLEPSPDTFGAADLNVLITPQPITSFLSVDNRGSRVYGALTVGAGTRSYNLLGLNERLDGLIAFAPEGRSLGFGSLEFEAPIAPLLGTFLDGARLRMEANLSRGNPDLSKTGSPDSLTSITKEQEATIGLTVPFIRTRSQNLFGSLGLTGRYSKTDTSFSGDTVPEEDRLAILDVGLSWDVADRFGGVNLVYGGLRQGLDIGDTYVSAQGPAAGEPDFTLIKGTLSRLQSLGQSPWSLYGELIWQYTDDVLPSSERFFLGGSTIGRGFAPGNTSGDSGYGVRLELRRYIDYQDDETPLDAIELYAYADYGRAFDQTVARDGMETEDLGSVGIGARIDLRSWLSLTPEIARQTKGTANDTRSGDLETRYFLGAVARF